MKNKDDEIILVIEPEFLPYMERLNGVRTISDDDVEELYKTIDENAFWARRGNVESNPFLKQIIPYTIITNGRDVLVYKRLGGSGEQRLVDLYSLGFGGHIGFQQQYNDEGLPAESIIFDSIARELEEELGLNCTQYSSPVIKGLLYAGKSEKMVDMVHVGLVNVIFTNHPIPQSTEENILSDPEFIHFFALRRFQKKHTFETWSNLVIRWLNTDPTIKNYIDDMVVVS